MAHSALLRLARTLTLLGLSAAAGLVACGSSDSNDSGTTVGRSCRSNGDCPGGEPYCQVGRCVECLDSANCGDPSLTCDGVSGKCLASCTSSAQCDGGRQCNVDAAVCVACLSDTDCTDNGRPYCIAALDACEECRGSADCGGAPCNNGHCEECATNANCPNDRPYCDPADNECRECLQNSQCGAGRICDGRECHTICTVDPPSCGPDRVCDAQSGTCVECLTDADCPMDNPGCINFECRECSTDEHCPAGETCDAGGHCR